jgi:DNA polymerase-3 subunit epsilon
MFNRWRYRKRCHQMLRHSTRRRVTTYLSECAALNVDKLDNTPLISVDLEMTGLDATQNHIIAIGWTQLDQGRIQMASNRHLLISAGHSVGHSAAIHELTDQEVSDGVPLEVGLEALFEAARGRAWLFHHAPLDVAFLQQACTVWAGVSMPFMVLDTMNLELTMRKRRELPVHHGDLQLTKLRANYNLPGYTAHNALIDACATAELLLAIAENMDTSGPLKLKPHLNYY